MKPRRRGALSAEQANHLRAQRFVLNLRISMYTQSLAEMPDEPTSPHTLDRARLEHEIALDLAGPADLDREHPA